MTPVETLLAFREAQSRANNVAHDLEDLEWVNMGAGALLEKLNEIADEIMVLGQVMSCIIDASYQDRSPPEVKPGKDQR